jgi:hypothetical protein
VTPEQLGSVLRDLEARGFTATPAKGRKAWRSFKGTLPSPKGDLQVLLGVKDWDFLSYPLVYVLGGLEKFPSLRPHLDPDGGLCYFAPGSVVLDRYDPAMAIAQCLEQAQAVLAKLLGDEAYRGQDVQNEFLVHWSRQQPPALELLFASTARGATSAAISFLDKGSGKYAVVASTAAQAARLSEAIGYKPSQIQTASSRCWLFHTDKRPPVPQHLPGTVSELFEWLRGWDRKLYNGVQSLLGRDSAYVYLALPIAVETPLGWIGFCLDMSRVGKRKPLEVKQYLHGRGGLDGILRVAIADISPQFVHSRNLSFHDMSGKRVTLVGCGAIGSYLAAALVRLGAGAGGGLLRLVDMEQIGAENLGRHYLGYDSLDKSKAPRLREELLRQFPLAQIEAVDKSVVDCPAPFAGDLLIDATGEGAVSEYLNDLWLGGSQKTPVLYVWIKGNGECVQCLWVDNAQLACFRCLKLVDGQTYRQERFPVLKGPPERKVLGCHSFTPYAVSAPMQAAALAADTISDWLKGNPSPRFRTRKIENVDLFPISNQDPTRLPGCPACSRT